MSGKNYYCLVAGLKEYPLDSQTKGFDARAVIEEVRENVSKRDRGYVDLLYTWYDIENIIGIRQGRSQFSALGNFSREELEEELARPDRLPRFIADTVRAYADPDSAEWEDFDREERFERSLMGAYYAECAESKCRFIREWSEFDRNLRNIAAAMGARRAGLPITSAVIGSGDVADALVRSSAADFGLRGEIGYIDQLIAAVAETGNLLEKEHRIDLIRWNVSEELTVFDYFNIDGILGYLVRINLVHRWAMLDPVRGREMFDRLVETLNGREYIGSGN